MSIEPTDSHNIKIEAIKAIAIFLAITGLFSAATLWLISLSGKMHIILVTMIMWAPGLAAILTCKLLGRSISSMPWQWGAWKWNWQSLWVPLVYAAIMYLPVWFLGWGGSGFPNQATLNDWSMQLLGSSEYQAAAAIGFGLLIATLGIIDKASRALGEEIGWRGLLVWELKKLMPFWAVAVVSGLIWGLWHVPVIMMSDYNAGEGNLWLQSVLFLINTIAMSLIMAYYTFKSNSLWPAVIMHASHNLYIQRIFTPLTVRGETTHLYVDEFGVMMPLVLGIFAIYFYLKARREGLA
ncbi:CPBP family intramembrane glutamic endopeptidase [Paraglaciecola aestuariivivens]